MKTVRWMVLLHLMTLTSLATASITVDGIRDDAYGPPLAVQTVRTRFGNEDGTNNGGNGVGSELDAAYAKVWDGRLYVMLTGNIQPNFNKLEVFIDSVAGGENTLTSGPQYDFFDTSQNMGGLTFDAGFEADYHLFARGGDPGGGRKFDVDFIHRAGGASASVAGNGASVPLSSVLGLAAGTILPADLPAFGNISGPALTQALDFAFNNSNVAGISGDPSNLPGAADPIAAQSVTTGLEFSISLVDLGSPGVGASILIAAMQNNSDHNYLSNQMLGGLPAGQDSLGSDGAGGFTGNLAGVDLNDFDGDQFFSVRITNEIPEPSANTLVVIAALGIGVRWGLSRKNSPRLRSGI